MAGSGYAGKPLPVVIVQDDRFDVTDSVTVCAVTTDPTEAPLIRLTVEPDDINGLRERCSLMVDKITTIPRRSLATTLADSATTTWSGWDVLSGLLRPGGLSRKTVFR